MDDASRGVWVEGEERVSARCHEKGVVSWETKMKQNGEISPFIISRKLKLKGNVL